MSVNEEDRQVEVARELSENARTLAHSTRDVPSPSGSYTMLSELVATIDDLEQVVGHAYRMIGTLLTLDQNLRCLPPVLRST